MNALDVAKKGSTSSRVTIEVAVETAKVVLITGEFNGWARDGVRLKHDGKGTWRTVLDLAPGEYQYRLLVDGKWHDHAPSAKRVPNPFGTENCVLVVS